MATEAAQWDLCLKNVLNKDGSLVLIPQDKASLLQLKTLATNKAILKIIEQNGEKSVKAVVISLPLRIPKYIS